MDILQGYGGQLFEGALMTLKVSFCSLFLGIILGLIGAFAKRSKSKVANTLANLYTTIIRGVPELLIIFLLFFGGTVLLTQIVQYFNPTKEYVEIDAFTAGFVALGIVFGAYATEVFRGALQAIPPGQVEAGIAVGMKKKTIVIRILLPQMWRYALPGLGNLWMTLLKDSALISIVSLEELLRKAYIAAGATRDPLTFYLAAACIYLLFTIVSMIGLHYLEKHANKSLAPTKQTKIKRNRWTLYQSS